ncbi:MAG: hypothetical protein K0S63_895 [Gammaproteobacteria bacterium]|jgi:hypothetical protein|nr:hypothetical protein [Gammaproteobacteria bacterium]
MAIRKDAEKNEEDKGGKGGKTGDVEFHLFIPASRDDTLSPNEMARLLHMHEELHKVQVDTQKATRKEREKIKNNPKSTAGYDSLGLHNGGGGGTQSVYKTHPLSNHAQFSGATDKKVTGVPSDNLAQTNENEKQELIEKLDLRFQHQHQYKNTPKFSPKPRPY